VGSNNNNNVLVTHFAYQTWSGDVDVVTQLKSIDGGFDYKQGGIAFTDTACNNSLWASISGSVEQSSAQQGVAFHLYGSVNGRATTYSTGGSGALPPPQWLRLNRNGSVVTGYYGTSATGPWTRVDSETIAFSDPILHQHLLREREHDGPVGFDVQVHRADHHGAHREPRHDHDGAGHAVGR
jgi:hypothetical protein